MSLSARHLVAIGITDPDIPEVSRSIEVVTNCLATLGYRQALPELANLQPGLDVKSELSQWAQTVAPEDFTDPILRRTRWHSEGPSLSRSS